MTRPLSILYIGNGTHSWCTEVHLARELRALGHRVEFFQEPHKSDRHTLTRIAQKVRQVRADLVLWTRTWGMPAEQTTAFWRELEANGIETASVHLDLYLGLQRQAGVENDPFWTTNFVFTPDGDPASQAWFEAHGINHHWSPPGVVYDECKLGAYREKFDYDVVFVGSHGYHPEWPWRPYLIDALRDRYGNRFRRFGGDQPEGPVRGSALNDLYATAKVVVGDSLALPGHRGYWSDRPYETLGRGGFLVMPRVPGLDAHFTDGEHLVFYDHPTYPNGTQVDHATDPDVQAATHRLFDLIDAWLASSKERDRVRFTGMEHVRANHTYRHRLARVIDTLAIEPRPRKIVNRRPVILAGVGLPADPPAPVDGDATFLDKLIEAMTKPITDPDMPSDVLPSPVRLIERLELGSGYHPTPGFVHLDLNPSAPDVDIVGPAYPLDLPDRSVGEIRAVDVLEHISYRLTDRVLADWFRVLRPGGLLYVQVPDAHRIMLEYGVAFQQDESQESWLSTRIPAELPQTMLMGATWRLLGGHEDSDNGRDGAAFNVHLAMFSELSLRNALADAGFTINDVQRNGHPNLMATVTKP